MNARYRLLRWTLALLLFLLADAASLHAQRRDTVLVIQSPGGQAYLCCYDFIITNRQRLGTTIAEFRVSIISGRARLVPGLSETPPNWAVFQGATSASWTANTSAAEIDSNESVGGFHVCVRDTGVFRMVWETRSVDSILTVDTVEVACTGKECEESFANMIPSDSTCGFDLDLVIGNRLDLAINDFHLEMLTPGARFLTVPTPLPSTWTRTKAKQDTLSFSTTRPMRLGEFAEGFRFFVDAPRDSVFRIAWWSTNFGEPVCRDTLTLRCSGLARRDSLFNRRGSAQDTCCRDLTLKNRHLPAGPVSVFTLKILTPGAKLASGPAAPAGWTRTAFNAAGDSVAFTKSSPLAPDDSARFAGFCFDNRAASTDTIRYRWTTWGLGVMIAQQNGSQICYRTVTRCDSIGLRIDSLDSPTRRCMFLTVGNRNNRSTPIERITLRISNDGTRRTLLTASAPPGWQVLQNSVDSVVFVGGFIEPGGTQSGFGICVSLGDETTQDPIRIYYRTASSSESICSDTLRVNLKVTKLCDTIAALAELPTSSNLFCCFRISLQNRGEVPASRDRIVLTLPSTSLIFASASLPQGSGWTIATQSFPSTDIELTGGTIGPGETGPAIDFCIDTRFFQNRPTELGLVWRTFTAGSQACTGTARLVCTPPTAPCDTFDYSLASDRCLASFTLVSRRVPPIDIETIRFKLPTGGRITEVQMPGQGWSETHTDVEATVTGPIPATGQTGPFKLGIDNGDQPTVRVEACTMYGNQVLCCTTYDVVCAGASVTIDHPGAPGGLMLHDPAPNPARTSAELRYEMRHTGAVSIVVRDAAGVEHRRVDLGREEAGPHAVVLDLGDLPAGVYYCTLTAGADAMTRPVVVLR